MTKYDPAFWEISVDPQVLESTLAAPGFLEQLLVTPEDERAAQARRLARQAGRVLHGVRRGEYDALVSGRLPTKGS